MMQQQTEMQISPSPATNAILHEAKRRWGAQGAIVVMYPRGLPPVYVVGTACHAQSFAAKGFGRNYGLAFLHAQQVEERVEREVNAATRQYAGRESQPGVRQAIHDTVVSVVRDVMQAEFAALYEALR